MLPQEQTRQAHAMDVLSTKLVDLDFHRPLLYWDLFAVLRACGASFLISADHPFVPVRATERHVYHIQIDEGTEYKHIESTLNTFKNAYTKKKIPVLVQQSAELSSMWLTLCLENLALSENIGPLQLSMFSLSIIRCLIQTVIEY